MAGLAGPRNPGAAWAAGGKRVRPLWGVVLLYVFAVGLTMPATTVHAAVPDLPTLHAAQLPDGIDADPQVIIAGALDASFQPLPAPRLIPSSTQPRWFRLHLGDDWRLSDDPVLSIRELGFTPAHVHAPPDFRAQALRFDQPSASFSHREMALRLSHGLDKDVPIYIRIDATRSRALIEANISGVDAYHARDLAHVRLVTLLISVQLTMVIVGLGIWLALRDRVFGWFVVYASIQLLYVMISTGEAYAYPGGSLLAYHGNRPLWFVAALSGAFALSFIIEFCQLRKVTPGLARVLSALRWPFFVSAALALLPPSGIDHLARPVINVTLLVASIVAIATVLLALQRGNRAARFFIVAWMPQVVFTAIRVTQILLGLPHPTWLEYGFPLSMSFATVVILLGLADAILHARRERDLAQDAAERDGLTGVLNRDGLMRRLDAASAHAMQSGQPLSLLFIDLDHFKSINDRLGHLAGDLCLKSVASAVESRLGQHRIFGRYGGEEFIAILPDTTPAQARVVGEQLRAHIEALRIESRHISAPLGVTASIGIAHWAAQDDTPERLIRRADRALYEAKAAGRNRIVAHACAAVVSSH